MTKHPDVIRRGAVALAVAAALTLSPRATAAQVGGAPPAGDRAQMEQQVRQRFARFVRERLQLTEPQMQQLQQTNRRFEEQRRSLVREERDVRVAIRDQLANGDRADQKRVAELIDRAIGVQRRRLDLLQSEQKELATFLTPVQRARYLDVQEKVRRRVEELRRRGAQGGGGPAGRRPLMRRGRPGGA